MKRIFFTVLIPLILFVISAVPALSNGTSENTSKNIYRELGYKPVDEAAEDFKTHFKMELALPLRVPPIPFTHAMGRINDLNGEEQDSFEVKYINDKVPDNHYKITIRPLRHKVEYKKEEIKKNLQLERGTKAVYLDHSGFNVLVFERGNLQYMLSINKRVSEMMLPGTLVQIANSIEPGAS
ncbi:hypothetical protein D3H55_23425 [Bacillus salacetis]|uniref:DUF4367 domain-containing protein n=1 Tax=Bacillus salacetis TaxID=2315464 RepID=A0A3A1QL96_9BACI|nr:hypothetical protein [Bacillus salacetis]RIW26867.1 hypothetical protein D3H55_23425 [Bacillus salacetis]